MIACLATSFLVTTLSVICEILVFTVSEGLLSLIVVEVITGTWTAGKEVGLAAENTDAIV